MPAFVHGAAGEKKWEKAKRAAQHAGASNKYAFATWWYMHHGGKKKSKKK